MLNFTSVSKRIKDFILLPKFKRDKIMGIKTNSDSDLVNVLKNDGVGHSELVKYENCSTVNLRDLREDLGMGSWRKNCL